MEKVYDSVDPALKEKLEKQPFLVTKWLLKDVAKRYHPVPMEYIIKVCQKFDVPILGEGDERFLLVYKPSVFEHPETNKKALQINFFELPSLNHELRKCFMNDYQGNDWYWHRFVWNLPDNVFKVIENISVAMISLFKSPKESIKIMKSRMQTYQAEKKLPLPNNTKVATIFNDDDIKKLAKLMRQYYCSCLWQPGDILLVDNRKVAHAGMPGAGPRTIRAMICNPLNMRYSNNQLGLMTCEEKVKGTDTLGFYLTNFPNEQIT